MPDCTILVGVPASGKSTWLDKQDFAFAWSYISTDIIIEEIADTYGFTYNEVFKNCIGLAEQIMHKHLSNAIESEDDIVIDRTNLTVAGRKKFIDKLKSHGYSFHAVVFPVPEESEWDRRLNSRPGKNIPQNVLDSMRNSYQEPTKDEGFDNIVFIKENVYE